MFQSTAKYALIAGALAVMLGYAAANLAEPVAFTPQAAPQVAPRAAPIAVQAVSSGREIQIPAGVHGQYIADVEVNFHPIKMLIDTGATDVALSASAARSLGLNAGGQATTIATAAGKAPATRIHIDHVAIGGIRLDNVEALILPVEAGDTNLLGMSFLSRLASVEQKNGAIVLKQ